MTARTVPHTTPYAWPWDGDLDPARTVALVVAPERGLDIGGQAGENLHTIVRAVRAFGGHVITVHTVAPPQDATAAKFYSEADLRAAGIDGFYGSGLDARLRALGADQLLLMGAGLETCVHSTMRSANDRGYECLLVEDACVAYRADLVAAARSQIEMSGGIFGAVGQTAHVLNALAAMQGVSS